MEEQIRFRWTRVLFLLVAGGLATAWLSFAEARETIEMVLSTGYLFVMAAGVVFLASLGLIRAFGPEKIINAPQMFGFVIGCLQVGIGIHAVIEGDSGGWIVIGVGAFLTGVIWCVWQD